MPQSPAPYDRIDVMIGHPKPFFRTIMFPAYPFCKDVSPYAVLIHPNTSNKEDIHTDFHTETVRDLESLPTRYCMRDEANIKQPFQPFC